jgi:hypothetical protein
VFLICYVLFRGARPSRLVVAGLAGYRELFLGGCETLPTGGGGPCGLPGVFVFAFYTYIYKDSPPRHCFMVRDALRFDAKREASAGLPTQAGGS